MDLTVRDIGLIVSMSIAIIVMIYTAPAAGVADGVNQTEPPGFNISADRFDFAGDFPENPGTPSSGTLEWREYVSDAERDNQRWLEDDRAVLAATTNDNEPTVSLSLFDDTGTQTGGGRANVTTNDTTERITAGEWKIDVTFKDIVVANQTNNEYNFSAAYQVEERPDSDGGFGSSIPIVGGLFSAGNELAGIVSWIGAVLWWMSTWLFEVAGNLLGIMFDVATFEIALFAWLTSSYVSVIAGVGGWASIVLAVPSIILALELSKVVMVFLSLLPTT